MTTSLSISDIIHHTIVNGGGTFSVDDDYNVTLYTGGGFAVGKTPEQFTAVPGSVQSFVDTYIDIIERFHPDTFGTWVNSDDGLIYIDPVVIFEDEHLARCAGFNYGQIAIFNLDTKEEIRL